MHWTRVTTTTASMAVHQNLIGAAVTRNILRPLLFLLILSSFVSLVSNLACKDNGLKCIYATSFLRRSCYTHDARASSRSFSWLSSLPARAREREHTHMYFHIWYIDRTIYIFPYLSIHCPHPNKVESTLTRRVTSSRLIAEKAYSCFSCLQGVRSIEFILSGRYPRKIYHSEIRINVFRVWVEVGKMFLNRFPRINLLAFETVTSSKEKSYRHITLQTREIF